MSTPLERPSHPDLHPDPILTNGRVVTVDPGFTIARGMGRALAERAIPMRSLIDAMGLDLLGQGTDFPVNPLDPFINMHVMTTRRDVAGRRDVRSGVRRSR